MLPPPLIDYVTASAGMEIDEDQETLAEAILDDVSALVRAEARQEWLNEDGSLAQVPSLAMVVTRQAFRRAVSVPIGRQSDGVGPYTATYDRDSRVGAYLTDAERRSLWSLRPNKGGGLRVIETTRRQDPFSPDVYDPVLVDYNGLPGKPLAGDPDYLWIGE